MQTHRFARSVPRDHNVDAAGVSAFIDAAEAADLGLHSLMIARHGAVVAEGWWTPYAADRVHLGYSLSKSFTATTVARLVAAGRFGLDDAVVDLLPAEVVPAELPARWREVRVRHCLTMTVGHDVDAWAAVLRAGIADPGPDLLTHVFAQPPDHQPGEVFTYNQVATYLLSRIVEEVCGRPLLSVCRELVLDPLGAGEVLWHDDQHGHTLGFSGIHVCTEDILALAQLHLDGGTWHGSQLLEPSWVAEAVAPLGPLHRGPDVTPDWLCGYGFSFWNATHGYRGDGAYGQYAIVVPELDLTIAITSEVQDMQATLDALWQHVLPACERAGSVEADEALARRLAGLAIEPLGGVGGDGAVGAGETGVVAAARGDAEIGHDGAPAGLWSSYTSVSVSRANDAGADAGETVVTLQRGDVELPLLVGAGRWIESVLVADDMALPVLASGGWQPDGSYRAEVLVIETPHKFTISLVPTGASSGVHEYVAGLAWRYLPLMGADPMWLAARPA